MQAEGQHGDAFAYKTVNSDVLAWVVQRATGTSFADLLEQRIWASWAQSRMPISWWIRWAPSLPVAA
ncbi:hypothetical protein ULF88_13305 [Halopseudomonas pachastrellae]|nr:hypothetical protein [Halopseudomonas pachastrellae]